MDKLINVTIYEPHNSLFKGSKNDKAESHYWYCSKTDSCDYYAKGQCMNIGVIGKPCPYGHRKTKTGFTKRASGYYQFISGEKSANKDMLYKVKRAAKRIAKIGDEWVLPYPFMNMNEHIGFKETSGFFSSGSPILSDLDADKVAALCKFVPRTIFGSDPIADYQLKSVPKFIKDLQDFYPDLYAETIAKYPDIASRVENYNYVGRRALINTLAPGCVVGKESHWTWDGEYLTSSTFKPLLPVCKIEEIFTKIKPQQDESIEITNNNQICDKTVFVD